MTNIEETENSRKFTVSHKTSRGKKRDFTIIFTKINQRRFTVNISTSDNSVESFKKPRIPPTSLIDAAWNVELDQIQLSWELEEGEGLYGFGERWLQTNMRGEKLDNWVQETGYGLTSLANAIRNDSHVRIPNGKHGGYRKCGSHSCYNVHFKEHGRGTNIG